MKKYSTFIGLDLGDRFSHVCVMDEDGQVKDEQRVATQTAALTKLFGTYKDAKVALETGTHSPWVSRTLEELGLQVYVANARKVRLISKNPKKNDRLDAQMLARLVRFDPELLAPVRHRGAQAQADLAVVQARDSLVRVRTALINTVRDLVKSSGSRLPSCSAESFAKRVASEVPELLRPAVDKLVATVAELTARIREYDEQLSDLCARYPETAVMQQISGVGPITSLAFALVIEDPHRFEKSRQVGPYLGLTPRQDQSGDNDPQLRITKAGNKMLRRLLVSAAHYIIGRNGPPTALREWGLGKAGTGSKVQKKKAVVGVARKLAILLHRLWVTGECYQPFINEEAA
jgi:transposase